MPEVPKGWTVTVEDARVRLPPAGEKDQKITIRVYGGAFLPIIQSDGFIPSFTANVEARTPMGDTWVPFGGITAVVHPVNQNSTIVLDPPSGVGPTVVLTGSLASSGPLRPPLGGREVHLRVVASDSTQTWITGITNPQGRFQIPLPPHLVQQSIRAKLFHAGGRGFAPTASNEISRNVTPGIPGIGVPGNTGVVGTVTATRGLGVVAAGLQRTGILSVLTQGNRGFTIFAPTDSALAAAGIEVSDVQADTAALAQLLSDHSVRGRLSPWEVRQHAAMRTLSGKAVRISYGRNVLRVGEARVVGGPIEVPGGVVYLLDKPISR